MLGNLLIFIVAFTAVFSLVFVLRPMALNVGLVDRPCTRKQHKGHVPLVGGLSIYVAITLFSFVLTPFNEHYKLFMLSTSFMVLIGALDDYHDIDARLRLIAQFLIGSLMVFGADLYIGSLGNIFGFGEVSLGIWGPFFTVLAVVTCINAFNMTDGIDGLIGVLSLNTVVSLGVLAGLSSVYFNNGFTSMLVGAILAFLFFNFGSFKSGRYKIFMGDAGSMLIGLTVMWLLTYMTSTETPMIKPVTALWLIAVPLMDMFSVMIRRIMAGHSPLRANRDHFHHVLIHKGYSNVGTTVIIGFISAVCCSVGVISELLAINEYLMVAAFVVVFALYNLIIMGHDKKHAKV